MCANPFTIVAGNNRFTNRAIGTLAMSGTSCAFSVSPQSISNSNFYRFTPASRAYTFSLCNKVIAGRDTKMAILRTFDPLDGISATLGTLGVAYFIVIGGYNSAEVVGSGTITVT